MGSSTSKAGSSAKTAARHFPLASAIQERTAMAAGTSSRRSAVAASAESSPKQDYLEEQRRLEEELARYDEQFQKSGKQSGESRPFEDTSSAAELQFFGNLKTLGQVKIPHPDQIKHQEAVEILKRKQPVKPISSSSSSSSTTITPSNFISSAPTSSTSSTTTTTTTTTSASPNLGPNLTSLKLMELLHLRNQDPSTWTVDQLSTEFGVTPKDIKALTKYVNTYTILPGKDTKGREAGVWCEDLRGVEVQDKPSAVKDVEETKAATVSQTNPATSSS